MGCLNTSAVTRREVVLALACGASIGAWTEQALSPKTFPWAVDRGAHLARRRVVSVGGEPSGYRGVLLYRLHMALDAWWRSSDGNMIRVRQHLLAVKSATPAPGTPADWREVHNFAAILLKAAEWRCV